VFLSQLDDNLKYNARFPAPPIAVEYYNLEPTATLYDVVKCVRADEAMHREVNHTFADMKADEQS